MSRIDVHVVRLHSVLNFVDDGLAGSLDTKNLGHFDNVIGGCEFTDNTLIPERQKPVGCVAQDERTNLR